MDEFTTTGGVTLQLRRVALRHVERIRAKFVPPDPPTYQFEAAGGVPVTKSHDESTLETDEEKQAWREYQAERNRVQSEQHLETVRFLIHQCVVTEPPPPEKWSVDWQQWGLDPPDQSDPVEYKIEWLESEVLVDPGDYAMFMSRLYQLGGLIPEEALEEFEGFFRTTMARLTAALNKSTRPPKAPVSGERGDGTVGES